MRNHRSAFFAGMILILAASPLFADAEARIKSRLKKLLPEYKVDSIEKTPVKGLFEIIVGPKLVYMSGDGRYMLEGRLVDLKTREDLTEPRRAAARKRAVDRIGENKMVIFAPAEYDHTITVFTDIDCGYCRRLHREISHYGAAGIRVRYVFFPRAGVNSDSYRKAVSVWCADDRRRALTEAKAGKSLKTKRCKNPVEDHMQLGQRLGISGTPTIVVESGDVIGGYISAKRLVALLDTRKP